MTCPVCRANRFAPLYKVLLQCTNCRFVTAAAAAPSEEDLKTLYGADYFQGEEYADYLGDKKVIQRNMRRWLSIVRQHVPSGSLVEIGSAYGFFLEEAQNHFRVIGYDVSEEAVEYANTVLKVPSRCQDFLGDQSLTHSSVDSVAMWDVIEHVDAPDRYFERAGEVLRDGGYLFLTTGDIDSWLARRQGPRWRMIHPPTHLQYFSKTTIADLLDRKGFEVVRTLYPGYWRTVNEILHGLFVLGKSQEPGLLFRMMNKVLPRRLGIFANTFDIMLVVAQKRPTASISK